MSNQQVIYGLIGYPIAHSQSPRLFREHSPLQEVGEYRLFPIKSLQDLEVVIQDYQPRGLNVTSPYKESILEYFEHVVLSPEVERVRAANVLVLEYEAKSLSRVKAYNTDVYGFGESLRPLIGANRSKTMILGTGGAARAVALALEQLGWALDDYLFVTRNPEILSPNLRHYLQEGDHRVVAYDDLVDLRDIGLIINASPVGLHTSDLPRIPYATLGAECLCYDLNYSEHQTPFLERCHSYGAKCVNGASMLRLQAEASWSIWLSHLSNP